MGALGPGELAGAFADAAPEVRWRACELAGRREDGLWEGCGAALIAALSDSSPMVVEAACSSLGELVARRGELGEEELVTRGLAAVARSHPDARCREASVAALGVIGAMSGGSDAALAAIAGALADKPSVRRRAVVALSGFNGDKAQRELERASCDRDWQVREIAQELLRAQPDVSAHEQVTD
jgi:HEAT repeat protein